MTIDVERVAEIISAGNSARTGHDLLADLEAEGYRVVPEGLVPQFEDLDTVERLLNVLGDIGGQVHDPVKCRQARNQIQWLRDLALLVLRIDRDVMMEHSGE